MAGLFVTFEGPEGAGKSTQIRLLAAWLRDRGFEVVETREPGGTPAGEAIRSLLLHRTDTPIGPRTEALLHTAARAQHVADVISPALERGEIVLCDRFVDSTLAYQGGGRGLPMAQLRAIQELATAGVEPNLRILLDLDVAVGLGRRQGDAGTSNRMDDETLAFHERVRAAYLELAAADPGGWIVIDATPAPADVQAQVRAAIEKLLKESGMNPHQTSAVTA